MRSVGPKEKSATSSDFDEENYLSAGIKALKDAKFEKAIELLSKVVYAKRDSNAADPPVSQEQPTAV